MGAMGVTGEAHRAHGALLLIVELARRHAVDRTQ